MYILGFGTAKHYFKFQLCDLYMRSILNICFDNIFIKIERGECSFKSWRLPCARECILHISHMYGSLNRGLMFVDKCPDAISCYDTISLTTADLVWSVTYLMISDLPWQEVGAEYPIRPHKHNVNKNTANGQYTPVLCLTCTCP
jgi:hypothetical protein